VVERVDPVDGVLETYEVEALAPDSLTVGDGLAFVCGDQRIQRLEPGGFEPVDRYRCDHEGGDVHGRDGLMLGWSPGQPDGANFWKKRLGREIEDGSSHGFSGSGVHGYGGIVALHFNRRLRVIDLDHPRHFFVEDLRRDPQVEYAYPTTFSVRGEAPLVGVRGHHALFFEEGVVRAFDFSDVQPVRGEGWAAESDAALAAEREAPVRVLLATEALLVLSGRDGLLTVHPPLPAFQDCDGGR